jgi:hypothetical protein
MERLPGFGIGLPVEPVVKPDNRLGKRTFDKK